MISRTAFTTALVIVLLLPDLSAAQQYLVQDPVEHVIRWQIIGLRPGFTVDVAATKAGGLALDLRGYAPGIYSLQTRYLMDDDNGTWSGWSQPVTLTLLSRTGYGRDR